MSDEDVSNARLIILDQKRIRHLFNTLREYYTEKNLDPILVENDGRKSDT